MSAAPVNTSSSKSGGSGSGFRGCLSCFGCGCAFPAIGLVILVVVAVLFMPRLSGNLDPALQKTVEITREDRWSLKDKLAAAALQENGMKLELSLPELNLLLSRIDLKPAAGFALNRVRAYTSNTTLSLVLDGSGFWMRRLNIVLHLETGSGRCRIARMQFNGYQLPELLLRRAGIPWLERWLNGAADIVTRLDEQTEYNFSVASDVIILEGPFPWLRSTPKGDGQ